MTKSKIIKKSLLALFVVILMYELLFGKLFPYSPILVGFSKHELANTIIYVQNGAAFSEYAEVDSLPPVVESFFQMKFEHKPKIIIFRDDGSFNRRSPLKARFISFPTGNTIVAPWAMREAREGKISLAIYLRHELSHILLFQHAGMLSKFKIPRWLIEGVAMYSANQMGTTLYPSKDETYRLIGDGNFINPRQPSNDAGLNVPNKAGFAYSEYACLVDYLINSYGKEKFLEYINRLCGSFNSDKVFEEAYGMKFDKLLANFLVAVNEKTRSQAKP